MLSGNIDIQKLQEKELCFVPTTSEANHPFRKAYNACRSFAFKPKNDQDIMRVLQYFLDRAQDPLHAKMPEDVLVNAQ